MSGVELKGLKGLRGLSELSNKAIPVSNTQEQIHSLAIEFLQAGQYQPRKQFAEEPLRELADSIKVHGIIQPLIVRRLSQGRYEIIAGERRWRAAQLAGLTHVPTLIRDVEDSVACAFALMENIQRADLGPVETAQAFARFRDDFGMTHAQIGQMVGRSRESVSNALRLLSLIPVTLEMLAAGVIDMGHARALLTLDPLQQSLLAHKIVAQKLTVRQTEQLAKQKKAPDRKHAAKPFETENATWSHLLSERLGSAVTVKCSASGNGQVVIKVESREVLQWLVKHLHIAE